MLTLTDSTLAADPQAAPAFPSAIPQSTANPIEAALYAPADEALAQWRRDASDKLDATALDFDAFEPGKDPWVRKRALVSAVLNVATDQDPGDGLAYEMLRDQVAGELFEGRGKGSDEAFFGEFQKAAQGRKDGKALLGDLQKAAAVSEAVRGVDSFDSMTFGQWRDAMRGKPGYDPKREADYLEAWTATREAMAENLEPYLGPLAEVWKAVKDDDIGSRVEAAYFQVPEASRPAFMASLKLLAESLPEEQRPTFWGNLNRQTLQGEDSLGRGIVRSLFSNMEGDAKRAIAYTPEQEALRQGLQEASRDKLQAMNFAADVRRIQQASYAPLKHVFPKGWQGVEEGLYGIPTAVASSAMAALPGGLPTMYLSMQGTAYDDMRARLMDNGLTDARASELADTLAPVVAAPQAALEKLQAQAIVGKLPFLEKAIGGLADRFTSRAARFGVRALAGAVEETAIERTQDFIPAMVQDIGGALAQDLPDVQWTGAGGELDGFWADSLPVFVTMLPLSIIGAAGGVSRDARAKAFAEASDTQLKALGATDEALAGLRAAHGHHSLNAAVDTLLATRDPLSESAKAAVDQLQAEIEAQQQAAQDAERSGVLPRFVRDVDGWTVYDGETHEEVGKAPDAVGAFRLARAHSLAAEALEGDRLAYLATMLQAGDTQNARDSETRQTTTDFRPGEQVTTAQQAAASTADEARVSAQVAAKERLNGGDGSMAQLVLGQSVTETKQRVRQTVNRLNAGASVLTVFHEEAHGFFREALATGRLTKGETVSAIRALETVLAGKTTKDGQALRFLPENDADIDDTTLDEAVAELMEAEVLRTRKGGGARQLPGGLISRNLTAIARLAPGAAKKLSAFIAAVRAYFGLAFARAVAIKQGIREGKVDEAKLDEFTAKLFGLNEQDEHDAAAIDAARELLEDGDPFSLGAPGFDARKEFPAAVDAILAGTYDMTMPVPLGTTPRAMRLSGANPLPLTMPPSVIQKASTGKHDLSPDTLKKVADAIHDPVFVFQSETVPDALTVILDLKHYGENVLVAVHLDKKQARHEVNSIASIYDKSNPRALESWIKNGMLLYAHTRKSREWFQSRGLQLPKEGTPRGNKNLRTEADLVNEGDAGSLSLGPAAMADAIIGNATARIKDPKVKARVFSGVVERMGQLKRDRDELGIAFGKGYQRKAIQDPRGVASIEREARVREALRRAELEDAAHAQHVGILSDPDLAKLKAQPVHGYLADPANPLKGRLRSRAAAARSTFFDETFGDYDGADGVSRTVFGGTLAPDQAAQELFERGLIREATPDALWEALQREAATVAKMKGFLKAAESDLKAARTTAKAEAAAWKKDRLAEERANYSPKARLLRSLAMLDGILMALPPDLRGRVGGYTQLAKLGSDEARLKFLHGRIEKIDAVVTDWLKKEYGKLLDALMARSRPAKDEAGKKRVGKIGADVHALFDVLRAARGWGQPQVDAHVAGLEAEIAKGEMTADEEAHAMLEASLVALVGNWKDADAARRGAAVEEATRVFERGYAEFRLAKLFEKEDRALRRESLKKATGKAGTLAEREARVIADNGIKGGMKNAALSLGSFEQLLEFVFGRGSTEALRIADLEREASNRKEDETQAKMDGIDDLFTKLAGNAYKGEELRWKLAQKSLTLTEPLHNAKVAMSELEAIAATLMWRQEDGRRHMEGPKDDGGKPAGPWHYDQGFIDRIEAALSREAKAVRAHLATEYASEYATLNPIYRQLYGVNLPHNPNYSPLTVKPLTDRGGQALDPITGTTMTGASTTPGSLRTRGQSIAEPHFRDALQTFIAHTKQMAHWKAYAPFTHEAAAVLRNRELLNAIEAKGGQEASSVLRGWLDFFTAGGTRDAAAHLGLNKLANRMASNAASAALIGRAGVLAVQSVQLGAGIAEMPTGAFVARFAKLWTPQGLAMWKAAFGSEYIQRRLAQMPPVVQAAVEGLKASKPNRLKYHVRQLGRLIAGADALFTAGTFAMVHDYQLGQAKALGLKGQAATAWATTAAERSTDRVAQPTRPGARSLFENTSTNAAMRVLWMFASESRQKLSLALWRGAAKDRSLGEKARAVAVTWLVGGMVSTLIRTAWRDLRNDDDEEVFDERNWDPTRLALSALTGPFGGIPFLGDVVEGGAFAVAGEYLPQDNLLAAVPRSFKAATRIGEWGEKKPDEIMKDVETILAGAAVLHESLAAASSVSHLVRDVFGIADNLEGAD